MDSSLDSQVTPRKLGHFLSLTPGQYHSRLTKSKGPWYIVKWPHSVETMETGRIPHQLSCLALGQALARHQFQKSGIAPSQLGVVQVGSKVVSAWTGAQFSLDPCLVLDVFLSLWSKSCEGRRTYWVQEHSRTHLILFLFHSANS